MSFSVRNDGFYYEEKKLLSDLPKGISIYEERSNGKGCLLKLSKTSNFATSTWSTGKIEHLTEFLALYRKQSYWYGPSFGTKSGQIPLLTTILWVHRKDGMIIVLVPLIHKGYNCYINGARDGIEILADNNCLTGNIHELVGLYVGIGEDFYTVSEHAAHAVRNFVDVGLLRKEKGLPKWVDTLGYCTWNTFYKDINQENVYRMLHHIVRKNGIPLGFLLLDDGWQITKYMGLVDKGADEKKFPEGMKLFLETIKKNFRISDFIFWHTFQGYWAGLLRKGPYGKRFEALSLQFRRGPSNREQTHPWLKYLDKIESWLYPISRHLKLPLGVALPSQMRKLWENYHGWLSSQGVTGVKVDNQSGTEMITFNLGYQANLMKDYHRALEESVSEHFSDYSLINCMSMNTSVFYQLIKSNITRNSDDYFPNRESAQPEHLILNAYNNLWTGYFSVPDWDMFQSNHPWGAYQAAARAISGSPIYFADDFQSINPKIIKKVALPNGKLLRCKNPALVCREMLFKNPTKPHRALKIFNQNRFNAVLGIFNAMCTKKTTVDYSPSDVEGLESNKEYAMYKSEAKSLTKMKHLENASIELDIRGFEIFTIAEIKEGFAPIGMLDKYNAGGIFEEIKTSDNWISIRVSYGGYLGFYSVQAPQKILCEGEEITFNYNPTIHFLRFNCSPREHQTIKILFGKV